MQIKQYQLKKTLIFSFKRQPFRENHSELFGVETKRSLEIFEIPEIRFLKFQKQILLGISLNSCFRVFTLYKMVGANPCITQYIFCQIFPGNACYPLIPSFLAILNVLLHYLKQFLESESMIVVFPLNHGFHS